MPREERIYECFDKEKNEVTRITAKQALELKEQCDREASQTSFTSELPPADVSYPSAAYTDEPRYSEMGSPSEAGSDASTTAHALPSWHEHSLGQGQYGSEELRRFAIEQIVRIVQPTQQVNPFQQLAAHRDVSRQERFTQPSVPSPVPAREPQSRGGTVLGLGEQEQSRDIGRDSRRWVTAGDVQEQAAAKRLRDIWEKKGVKPAALVLAVGMVAALATSFIHVGEDSNKAEAMATIGKGSAEDSKSNCYDMGKATVKGSGKIQWKTQLDVKNSKSKKAIFYPGYSKTNEDRGVPIVFDNSFAAAACFSDDDATIKRRGSTLDVSVNLSKVSYGGEFASDFTYEPLVLPLPKGMTEAQYDASNPISWSSVQELNALLSSETSQSAVDILAQAETLNAVATQCGQQVLDKTVSTVKTHFESVAKQNGLTLDIDIVGKPPALNDSVASVVDQPKPNNEAKQIATKDGDVIINNVVSTCEGVQ